MKFGMFSRRQPAKPIKQVEYAERIDEIAGKMQLLPNKATEISGIGWVSLAETVDYVSRPRVTSGKFVLDQVWGANNIARGEGSYMLHNDELFVEIPLQQGKEVSRLMHNPNLAIPEGGLTLSVEGEAVLKNAIASSVEVVVSGRSK